MIYEVTGKVIALPPMQTGMGQNGPWARQTVVLEYTESANDGRIFNYQMALESSKQAEEMSRLRLGDVIKCRFKVTSREYNGKYYTTAQVIGYNLENGQTYAAPPCCCGCTSYRRSRTSTSSTRTCTCGLPSTTIYSSRCSCSGRGRVR